jgi:hypothetical protein
MHEQLATATALPSRMLQVHAFSRGPHALIGPGGRPSVAISNRINRCEEPPASPCLAATHCVTHTLGVVCVCKRVCMCKRKRGKTPEQGAGEPGTMPPESESLALNHCRAGIRTLAFRIVRIAATGYDEPPPARLTKCQLLFHRRVIMSLPAGG